MEQTHEDVSIRGHVRGETVEVEALVAASAGEAWEALIRPERMRQWLGALDHDLQVRQDARIDYRDGDYQLLRPLRIEAPHRLEYMARLFGIGPVNNVSWAVVPHGSGSRVIVSDTQESRPEHQSAASARAWSDYLTNLAGLFQPGTVARYPRETPIQASIELPVPLAAAWTTLFGSAREQEWLPIDSASLAVGTAVVIPGAKPPSVTELSRNGTGGVHFTLRRDGWLSPLQVRLELTPLAQGSLLSVHQDGGEGGCICGNCWLPNRRSWVQRWVESLQRARQITG